MKKRIEDAEFYRNLGAKIRDVRNKEGWTQHDLAEYLGLTFQQIQKYENGTNRIPVCRLKMIADRFRKPIAYFVTSKVLDMPKAMSKTDGEIMNLVAGLTVQQKTVVREMLKGMTVANERIRA